MVFPLDNAARGEVWILSLGYQRAGILQRARARYGRQVSAMNGIVGRVAAAVEGVQQGEVGPEVV